MPTFETDDKLLFQLKWLHQKYECFASAVENNREVERRANERGSTEAARLVLQLKN